MNEVELKSEIERIDESFPWADHPDGILWFPTEPWSALEVEVAERELARRGHKIWVIRCGDFRVDNDPLGLPHRAT